MFSAPGLRQSPGLSLQDVTPWSDRQKSARLSGELPLPSATCCLVVARRRHPRPPPFHPRCPNTRLARIRIRSNGDSVSPTSGLCAAGPAHCSSSSLPPHSWGIGFPTRCKYSRAPTRGEPCLASSSVDSFGSMKTRRSGLPPPTSARLRAGRLWLPVFLKMLPSGSALPSSSLLLGCPFGHRLLAAAASLRSALSIRGVSSHWLGQDGLIVTATRGGASMQNGV